MKKSLILAATAFLCVSAFAFTPGQDAVSIDKEVAERLAKGETLQQIAAAAKAANVPVATLVVSLNAHSPNTSAAKEAIVAAAVTVGYPPAAVVSTLVSVGGNQTSLVTAAVKADPKVDPTALLAATASGPATQTSQGTGETPVPGSTTAGAPSGASPS